MRKLVGVIGSGNIGRDPFDVRSWSGSSRFFFNACKEQQVLSRAFGVEVPAHIRIPLMAKNFHWNKRIWREKFYHDAQYYNLLTNEIEKQIQPSDFESDFIQIGAIYDVPKIVAGRSRCFSYHDGDYINAIRSPYRKNLISKQKERSALAFAADVYKGLDRVYTMSDFLTQSLIEGYDLPPEKVKTIGAGINFELPRVGEKSYDKQNLLFIGIDFKRKGGEFVLKAFKKIRQELPNAELHIVGPENVEVSESLTSGVTFHGFIKKTREGKAKFNKILSDASLFVLASEYEPFGIAPLEAMSNKIPCLLPNKWAFPEMVTRGSNGELFELGNESDFVDKAKHLLTLSQEQLSNMGESARDNVETRFTWDIVARRLVSDIAELDSSKS